MADVDFGGMVGDFLDGKPVVSKKPAASGQEPPATPAQPAPLVSPGAVVEPTPVVPPAPGETRVTRISPQEAMAQAEKRMQEALGGAGAEAPPDDQGEAELVPGDVLPQEPAPIAPPAQPAEEPEPPEIASNPKARNAWTKSKQEIKQLKAEIATVKAQLDEAKKAPPVDAAEIEKLKQAAAEKAQLEERLGKLDVTQSAEFRKQYEVPINAMYQKTLAALVQAGKTPEAAKDLIGRVIKVNNDPAAVQELIAEEAPLLQGVLYQNGLEMIELQKRRASAIQNWKTTKAALREEEQRTAQAALQTQMEGAVSSAVDALRNEGSWAFKPSATNQEWNAAVEQRIEAVKGILKSSPPDVLAKYVAEGVAATAYREYGDALRQQNAKLRQQLAAVLGSRPGLGARGDFQAPPRKDEGRRPIKPEDYLDGALGSGT